MENDILLYIDNPHQLEKYGQTNQLLSGHLKLYIPNSNTTYYATDIDREAFKAT